MPSLGHPHSALPKAWRQHKVEPGRAESFRYFTDPELVVNVTDAIGHCLNPLASDRADDPDR